MEVEDKIQLAHIPEISVQDFHEVMHQLQSDQLIIAAVNAHDKVQTGIALVHHLQWIRSLSLLSTPTTKYRLAKGGCTPLAECRGLANSRHAKQQQVQRCM